jgi:P63C domain
MTDGEKEATGRAKGGVRRAEILPPEKRREIAQKGAAARWAKPIQMLHKGSFLQHFGTDIDCYVLDDHQRTAVISKRGMGPAIGLGRRGDRLMAFVNSQAMEGRIGRELREKLENPVIFQRQGSAAKNPISDETHGYDATILIDLCEAILSAHRDGKLQGPRYEAMIRQAQIVLSASAKSGIKQLVYALSGYNPSSEEVIAAFKLYVMEEAKKYEPEFPSELYMQWHRLYTIPVLERGRSWHFKHLTVRHIYYPLAKSSGKLLALLRALKSNDGNRQKKLFQFLNEVGARALRMHLGRVLEMAESSADLDTYEKKIRERFGDQQELELVMPSSNELPPPS